MRGSTSPPAASGRTSSTIAVGRCWRRGAPHTSPKRRHGLIPKPHTTHNNSSPSPPCFPHSAFSYWGGYPCTVISRAPGPKRPRREPDERVTSKGFFPILRSVSKRFATRKSHGQGEVNESSRVRRGPDRARDDDSPSALDMSCLHVWSANTQSADLSKWFPSGRRPILGTSCYPAHLKGKIVVGDADEFARLLREHHPFLTAVGLTSPGGDVAEAMKVGRMIRGYLLYTGVTKMPFDPDAYLAQTAPRSPATEFDPDAYLWGTAPAAPGVGSYLVSACFLIWAAGVVRVEGKIGLRRPIPTDLVNMAPSQASAASREP